MPFSPILTGNRPGTPASWTRSNWTLGQGRAAGLVPPSTGANSGHDNVSYDFTWHHNIPWALLRDSFNVVVVFCSWTVVDAVMDLYDMGRCGDIKRRIRNMRVASALHNENSDSSPADSHASGADFETWFDRFADTSSHYFESLKLEDQLTADNVEVLWEKVAWQRWNIVEGPKESIRTDDPGSDRFDDFRAADPEHDDRYKAVYAWYQALQYILGDYDANQGQAASAPIMRRWSARLQTLLPGMQFLRNQRLMMFNPAIWRVDTGKGNPQVINLGGKDYYKVRLA